jgi:PAS domain S-box-containing protein
MLHEYASIAYAIINFTLALIIYLKSRRNLLSRFYLFCVSALVLLGAMAFLATQSIGWELRETFEQITLFLFSFTPYFFLHFVVVFLRRYEILRSRSVIVGIYFAAVFSYLMALLQFIPRPVSVATGISSSGYVFYITWMSIFFSIGIALMYSLVGGFSEREAKSKLLLVGYALLLLLLPGPFTQSVFTVIFQKSIEWYFISSTFALAVAIYLVFRHRIILNTPYQTLKATLAAMNDILIKMDESFKIEMLCGAAPHLLGYADRELVGRRLYEIFEPTARLEEYRQRVLQGKVKESFFDGELKTKSGRGLFVNFSFTPVFANEEVTGFVGVARDMTERKKAEELLLRAHDELERRVDTRTRELAQANEALRAEISERKRAEVALRESEQKYRTLFEESRDVIFISTPEGKFLDINPAGAHLFGYDSPAELLKIDIGRDLFCNPQGRENYRRDLEQNGFLKDRELVLRRKDSEKVVVLETVNVVRDDAGRIIAYRGTMRDVTHQKQLEQQLMQSQKLESIGTLAGGIAHDFNNILAIILGYTSRLRSGTHSGNGHEPTNGQQRLGESVEEISKAVQRGARLVQQLLTFARKTDVLFEPMNINSTVEELVRMLAETFPKTIRFRLLLEKDVPVIVADSNQLHQALLNLCVNARDAMPNGGWLSLRTSTVTRDALLDRFPEATAHRYVQISVEDSGIGMDETTKLRIFEPFFTTKERGKGTGLGLAVVYGIVKNHNGFIDVESEPGRSTTFNLYLPVALKATVDTESEQRTETAEGHETILLVEDEEPLLKLLRNCLQEKGYRVLTARDGNEAIEIYKEECERIALVFADMGLPIVSGFEAFLRMKNLNPQVKVIFGSGYLDPNAKSELLKKGARDFLLKPYEPDDVLQRIRTVLDRG